MRRIQPSLRDLGNPKSRSPTLKRWAILVCPSRTKVGSGLARILWDQILAALDTLVRRKLERFAGRRRFQNRGAFGRCCGQECPRAEGWVEQTAAAEALESEGGETLPLRRGFRSVACRRSFTGVIVLLCFGPGVGSSRRFPNTLRKC